MNSNIDALKLRFLFILVRDNSQLFIWLRLIFSYKKHITTLQSLTFIEYVSLSISSHFFISELLFNLLLIYKLLNLIIQLLSFYILSSLLLYMAQIQDQEGLSLLLKCPKKKYIKHIIEYSACLNSCHNYPPLHFKTPIIQSIQADLQLTTEQFHKLLLSLSNLIEVACAIGFDFQNKNVFSEQFDPQLKQILINSIEGMQAEIEQSRVDNTRIGNKIIDFNWKLDVQVANQKGKSNTPNVMIQIQSLSQAELQVDKIQMKGEQFMAFFGNLKKVKDALLQLVDKGQ